MWLFSHTVFEINDCELPIFFFFLMRGFVYTQDVSHPNLYLRSFKKRDLKILKPLPGVAIASWSFIVGCTELPPSRVLATVSKGRAGHRFSLRKMSCVQGLEQSCH